MSEFEFISWSVVLGSGTPGGTLAPVFTIGGGAGASIGAVDGGHFPQAEIDLKVAALLEMAAAFDVS